MFIRITGLVGLLVLLPATAGAGDMPHAEYLKARSLSPVLFMDIYNEHGADMRRAELLGACGFDAEAETTRQRVAAANKEMLKRTLPERAREAGITHAGTMLAHSDTMSLATGYGLGYGEAVKMFLRDSPGREAQCAALKDGAR